MIVIFTFLNARSVCIKCVIGNTNSEFFNLRADLLNEVIVWHYVNCRFFTFVQATL